MLSIVILFLEVCFVAFNYQNQERVFHRNLQEKAAQVRSSFELGYRNSRQQMVQLANYVASSPAIQQVFLAGRQAVEKEGGGAGGPLAAKARAELLDLSQKSWLELEKNFDFRHMQFHLPPGAISFLRVHKPNKYGDDLTAIRHTIVVADENQKMTSGSEIGRILFGIRGASPVFVLDAQTGERSHVGTLEFGTSLKFPISALAENQGVELAILLDMEPLKRIVWPEVLQQKVQTNGIVNSYLIEEASLVSARTFLQNEDVKVLLTQGGMGYLKNNADYYWLATFPLRDFAGEHNPERPDVGRVVIWQDVTKGVLALQQTLKTNILIAVLGFLLIEALLLVVLKLTTGKLEAMVVEGRSELAQKNADLQQALDEVKTLGGLLPICAYCKKIRDDSGYWNRLENYIESHTTAQFSHGICDDCMEERFPGAKEKQREP
ncbi:MAG: hypothetical protein BA864_03305 [Desulfuromonadales bacterium C00003093]|nr:MAG: hypothetical protein BA864_03305 [Desulfuromonadales bacterium C00003093]